MTTAVLKGFVLFICLFFTVVQSISCEASKIESRKKHENDVAHQGSAMTTGVWNQEKPKRLFARTRYLSQQRHHGARPKPRPEAVSPAQTPARRCAGLTESCSSLTPCCDPCASCHCRLFNTICHCWRLGHLCPKKT
ncbi:agouti-signaling protein 2b [Danio aesculapii]|uniref:agouti-signaling protein 2b n=1 Tax=Danio aesculapii TaxID=1142201 RepID=UPI0024C06056|nr:agouti-signaling protein 2b [Danio aesculapii]